jgi:heptosyltransferase-3
LYPDPAIRRVLIYRTGSLGDTIVALPSLHLIARAFPCAERVLLTDLPVHAKAPTAMAVLGGTGLVHRDMRYCGATRKIGEMLRMIWEIRRFRPDVLVHLMPRHLSSDVRRDRLFFRLAGLRRIVGLTSGEVLKHRFDPATGLYESEASLVARWIAELGDADPGDIRNWDLHLTPAECEAGALALGQLKDRPLILCGPGTKMQAKDWGQDNWRELLGRLYAKYPSHGLVMIGVKEETGICENVAIEWTGAKVNLAGRLSPRESAAILSNARVFIGPDSGPMHLAASVRTPCVIAFSARALPGTWYPVGQQHRVIYHQTECYGCYLQTCTVKAKKCMRSITTVEMEQAVDAVLSQPIQSLSGLAQQQNLQPKSCQAR